MIATLAILGVMGLPITLQAPPLCYAVQETVRVVAVGGTPAEASALVRSGSVGGSSVARVVWYVSATAPVGVPARDPAAVAASWAANPDASFSSATQSGYSLEFASLPNPTTGVAGGSLQIAGGDASRGLQFFYLVDRGCYTCPTVADAKALVRAVYCLRDAPGTILGRWSAAATTFDQATRVTLSAWPVLPTEAYSLMR